MDQESQIPTILLMSSLDGTDTIGPFFLSRFLSKVSEISESDVEMSYLLNNYRILVIPTANIFGFYSNQKEEKTANGKLVDVELDFNSGIISDQQRCFQSTTARILAHIFKVIIKLKGYQITRIFCRNERKGLF